jgi:hypothetical protein
VAWLGLLQAHLGAMRRRDRKGGQTLCQNNLHSPRQNKCVAQYDSLRRARCGTCGGRRVTEIRSRCRRNEWRHSAAPLLYIHGSQYPLFASRNAWRLRAISAAQSNSPERLCLRFMFESHACLVLHILLRGRCCTSPCCAWHHPLSVNTMGSPSHAAG